VNEQKTAKEHRDSCDKEPLHYNRSNCESFRVNAPSRRLHKDNFTA